MKMYYMVTYYNVNGTESSKDTHEYAIKHVIKMLFVLFVNYGIIVMFSFECR